MEYCFNLGGKTLFNKMPHFMFFNLGYFRIRICFKSHSTTTPKTLSQEKEACSNSSPGNYTNYISSFLLKKKDCTCSCILFCMLQRTTINCCLKASPLVSQPQPLLVITAPPPPYYKPSSIISHPQL